jgi:hypothetical protein
MYKLSFFVPEKDANKVKQALFDIGVGRIGDYDSCCWQTLGTGQFRGLEGSSPTIGKVNQVEYVQEYKVEMVCSDDLISSAITTLKSAHPYEEVAYEYYKINSEL